MRKTSENSIPIENRIAVTLPDLCMLLSCGQVTARNIASEAKAVCYFGKRTLYNVQKIQTYLDKVAVI